MGHRYRPPGNFRQFDGNISLPLAGTLSVAGLTLPQIRANIGAATGAQCISPADPGRP
ncbi:polysaccharide biosynthesis/export family protein [Bradyrhizobium diazoefficiens]|uniref:polysaccharide biosynthesis/export family protein n=1 Tax=Bradyrhizobium diazoefficiens TaxID=1355477 RepID=UPI001FCF884D|nr:polysaccharide biosynthesis/export family protein [Bradyrhizobium diazoefficiens]